jgi:nucleotide-binding universal stress UspA family protein
MSGGRRHVLVGTDESDDSDEALVWALEDARARSLPVRVIFAYRWRPPHTLTSPRFEIPADELHLPRHVAEQVVGRVLDRARQIAPDADVDGDAIDGDPVRALIAESARAAELVLGSRHLHAVGSSVLGSVSAAVAARSACPAIVIRGPSGVRAEGASVVVGVDATPSSETVLGYAFDYASHHAVPLRAVLCWHPDLLASRMWRPEPPASERAEAWLSEALAGWREKYPEVEVHGVVMREHAIAGLVGASLSQHLLVVGSHGHHALTGTLLGSVSQGVLHHATCPVAIVPTHD